MSHPQEATTVPSPETAWLSPEVVTGEPAQQSLETVLDFYRQTGRENIAEILANSPFVFLQANNSDHWLKGIILLGFSDIDITNTKTTRFGDQTVIQFTSPEDDAEQIAYNKIHITNHTPRTSFNSQESKTAPDTNIFLNTGKTAPYTKELLYAGISHQYSYGSRSGTGLSTGFLFPNHEAQLFENYNITDGLLLNLSFQLTKRIRQEGTKKGWIPTYILVQQIEEIYTPSW